MKRIYLRHTGDSERGMNPQERMTYENYDLLTPLIAKMDVLREGSDTSTEWGQAVHS